MSGQCCSVHAGSPPGTCPEILGVLGWFFIQSSFSRIVLALAAFHSFSLLVSSLVSFSFASPLFATPRSSLPPPARPGRSEAPGARLKLAAWPSEYPLLSLLFSHSVMSPRGLQPARLLCPPLSLRVAQTHAQ